MLLKSELRAFQYTIPFVDYFTTLELNPVFLILCFPRVHVLCKSYINKITKSISVSN